ncbi:MAG: thioredoxin family protein [Lewinellaceae bacterium]|nr:thioredoxin family protein [Saprospiraceae bacterium]MCB9344522.1 thioredoxin family protein [Lewinellaceae bacterium]
MKKLSLIGLIICAALGMSLFLHENQGGETETSLGIVTSVSNMDDSGNPEELGKVHWDRNLESGHTSAVKAGKPMLILFQEVPGCSNCTRFGNSTLSHPLIVEAIETYFIPVCIYNNKGGKDAEALKKFKEPSWNNPVVRIVDANYSDLVPRMPNFNSPAQLVRGINQALTKNLIAVPPYLQLLEEEMEAREKGLETATFSMYCFWKGEGIFGNIPGVIETEPGFQSGKEVVKVQFNPAIVEKAELKSLTNPQGVSACSNNNGFSIDREPKYYLSHTEYAYLPMTTLQACRANSLIGDKKSPEALFSPRQLELLKKVSSQKKQHRQKMIGRKDLATAWEEVNM